MSAHAALRRAARPLRGAALFRQLAAATAPKPLSHPPPICLRRSIPAPGARLFSTSPPPPRQPPPPFPPRPTPDDNTSKPEPESSAPKDAPSTTPTPPPPPPEQREQPPQSETGPEHKSEPAPTSEPSSSTPPSSPEPSSEPSSEQATPPPPPETEPSPSSPALPSFTETHRHPLSARFSTFMDNLQSRALTATQKINDLTGYSAIESIKLHNTQLEHDHAAAQRRLRAARHDYKSLTAHRAATQREVTTLLTRKDMWNPADLERFTTLYRLDHELETQVAAAAEELTEAETDEGRLSGALNAGILRRYHEEQIWSDRIRRQSTWGTWGLMGVNVVLFLVLQFVAEPWRRRRLMKGIAEGERGVLEEVRAELGEVRAALEASGLREWGEKAVAAAAAAERAVQEEEEATAAAAAGEAPLAEKGEAAQDVLAPAQFEHERGPPRPWKEVLVEYWEDPELLREAVLDLSSDRRVDLRMRDASLIALQGAAAGATVAVVLAISLLRLS